MSHINLTKKAVGSGRLLLSDDGQHITNGHWACKRAMLKQAALLTSVEALAAMYPSATADTIKADNVRQISPRYADPITYSKTQWVKELSCGDAVLFVGTDRTSQVWLDRTYVKLFDLESVKAPPCDEGSVCLDPVCVGDGDDWDVLVMPMMESYQEGLQ